MRNILIFITFVLSFAFPAWAEAPIPERRVIYHNDVDFPGADLRSIFDTTQAACETACLASRDCHAFTFNSRSGACFLKSQMSASETYGGAFSARVVTLSARAVAQAEERAAELGFTSAQDLERARQQALDLPHQYAVGEWLLDDLLTRAAEAEANANLLGAMRNMAAAVALGDTAGAWMDYARLSLAIRTNNYSDRRRYREQGLSAAINAYLRAGSAAERASVLAVLAEGLEANDRGRDMISALRLAQSLAPRDDIARALDTAVGKYGFRITDDEVQSDLTSPRICATFSEDLASNVDYAPYVQMDQPGLAVVASGRQLCVEGIPHGTRARLTFRAGLPAASGEVTVKPVTLTSYVADRAPSVHFPGRAYVLPPSPDAGLPLVGVNAPEVELTLYRVSDRNLVRSMQERLIGRSLSPWEEEGFAENTAQEIWTGTGELQVEQNREVTTRLPMGEAIADQPPGVFVLVAKVPGQDPYDYPPATQWFVISDTGLATMMGADGLHVFARALGTAEALEGARIDVISRANEVLGTAHTDANGYASFSRAQVAGRGGAAPALIVARAHGDDIAFLSLTDPAFDLSDRGVEGHAAPGAIDLFLTTDRGAYRAGEVINATALARTGEARAFDGLPITAVLTRPDGVEYSRQLSQGAGAGGHVFAMPVGATAPRGTWRLEMFADPEAPALAATTLLVEDFLPERIDFDLTLPEVIRTGDRPRLDIAARYLFGAPGGDLPIEGDVILRAARSLDAFPGYVFGPEEDRPTPARRSLGDGVTDANGLAMLPIDLPEMTAPGSPLELTVVTRVSEGSGRPVERRVSQSVQAAGPVIGLRPLFDGDLPEGSTAAFNVIALDATQSPSEAPLSWTLNRVETRYQWYRLDGYWRWDAVHSRTAVASGDLTSATDPVTLEARVDWGRYELVVETADGAPVRTTTGFYAGWYGVADASSTPDMLQVALDREAYAPGDTATLRVVPRSAGKGVVTVMSNRLIHMQPVDFVEGENTVTLPVTDDWGAGAYVTATLIQPLDGAKPRTPTRALGLAHATVDPGARHLAVTLDAPTEARPRGPLDVTVNVDSEGPAFVTLAAVDQGILNLTSFVDPDPADHYFGQRRLGLGLRDLYGRLIDGQAGVMGRVRSGGDAMATLRMQAPPPTEELMAQFFGPIPVEDGKATVTLDLPEFNGSVRLMAVAWSAEGVGNASGEMQVRDPVVMTASLPRFLQPGDSARLLLELVHADGPAGDVQLSVDGHGVTVDASAVPDRLSLGEGGKLALSLPVTATAAGLHQINLVLHAPDGSRLTKTLMLPVEALDPETSRTSRFELAAGATFTLDHNAFAGLIPGSGRATLASGPLGRINVPALLTRLDRYPYGCTEQTTSRALPLLYFGPVAEAMGLADREDVPDRITDAIARVLANQASSGSFGLWRPDSGDLWLDAYVSDFLSRARATGHTMPDGAFRRAMDNLRNRVNYASDFDEGGEAIAYALYVLAREGAAAMGDLRYYADVKGGAFSTPLASAQMGAALAAYGDQTRADRMFAQAMNQVSGARDAGQLWRVDYGTSLRDAAAVLALATEAGSQAVDREVLVARVAEGDGHLSTQEATWSLMATNALIGDAAAQGLTLNGAPLTGPLATVLEGNLAGATRIVNTGEAPVTLTLTTTGVSEVPEPAGGKGYTIERRYFTMEGAPVDPDEVIQGTRLVAVLTVTPWANGGGRLMVADPLPAGFEIDNPHLLRGGDIRALDWLEVIEDEVQIAQFRQDRFLAAVDWSSRTPFRLAYVVRAVTPGVFHHAAASVEDMYRPTYRAHGDAGQVRVVE
ncbi:alpha-2-macroglobulin family protein [Aliiroseovarius sp.]|uniref:alpha-2-macroglobulin family protein n=1 Tax=Aliiroseovarius sp. TaxID=1872442 RepID=UPI003BABE68E